jgi:ABC-type multidrug transport system fused ATPase/permease subunit
MESQTSTKKILLALWKHVTVKRRMQLSALLVVMIVSGIAELLSLGSLIPFLGVLSNAKQFWEYSEVQEYAKQFNINSADELLWPATILFGLCVVCSALIRILNLSLNGRMASAIGSDFSCEAYRRTLYQPYIIHLKRNSGELIANITTLVARTVAVIAAALQLMTATLVAVCLIVGLFCFQWFIALLAVVLFGTIYTIIAISSRKELRRNSKVVSAAAGQQVKALQEGLGAIRDVIMGGTQEIYLRMYREVDLTQRKLQERNAFLGSYPRFVVESTGMVIIALLGSYIATSSSSPSQVVALLGAFALGSQRLLPAFQQIYNSWSIAKRFSPDVVRVLELLDQQLPSILDVKETISFERAIALQSVYFKYDEDGANIVSDINIKIMKGEKIGLVGSTGSGKSTLIDILIGLKEPSTGILSVDDVNIFKKESTASSWRSKIAYVPQSIYLADTTLAENIAFGIPLHHIDFDLLKDVAKIAHIQNFIEQKPQGYMTLVGERGVLLSGGQRQRIGIARALYKQAEIIVFDEATSALDLHTEDAIIKSINSVYSHATMVMIAHRLSTLQNCNRILRLLNGTIIEECKPERIL